MSPSRTFALWRILAASVFSIFVLSGAVWKPGAIEKSIVDRVLRKVSQTTPYEIRTESVSGNFIDHVTLRGFHLTTHGDGGDLVTAQALEISVKWSGLLHHRLEIRQLALQNPVVHVTINESGEIDWPKASPAPQEDSSFAFSIDRLAVSGGRVLIRKQTEDAERSLTLSQIDMVSALTPQAIAIQKMGFVLGTGRATTSGRIERTDAKRVTLTFRTQQIALTDIASLIASLPKPLRLVHSGTTVVSGSGKTWDIRTEGLLSGANLVGTARLRPDSGYRTRLTLRNLALNKSWSGSNAGRMGVLSGSFEASAPTLTSRAPNLTAEWKLVQPSSTAIRAPVSNATLRLDQGRGPLQINLIADGLMAAATGQIDWPAQTARGDFSVNVTSFSGLAEWVPAARDATGTLSLKGTLDGKFAHLAIDAAGEAHNLRWQDAQLESSHLRVRGALSDAPLVFEGDFKNIAVHGDAQTAWDMTGGNFTIDGKMPTWKAHTQVKFRNGTEFGYTGQVVKERRAWLATWDKLTLTPKSGAALHATRSGTVRRGNDGALAIDNLGLSNGRGALSVSSSTLRNGMMTLRLTITDLALESLSSLLAPNRKYSGTLNAECQLQGPWRTPEGVARLRVSTGSVNEWSFRDVDIRARLAPPLIYIDRLEVVTAKAQNGVHGKGQVPFRLIDNSMPDEPLAFHLEAPSIDPSLWTAALPGLVLDKNGNASINVDVSGRSREPQFKGKILVHYPRVTYAKAGVDIHDFNIDLETQGRTLNLRDLSGKTKKGQFHGRGESQWPKLDFALAGNDLQLKIPKKLDARFDADLHLTGEYQDPGLSGEITLKDVTYYDTKSKKETPKKGDSGDTEGEDTLESDEPTLWESLELNLHSSWTRNVWYRSGLSKVETSGDVRIQKDGGDDGPYMTGRISIVRGSYDIYGRDFILNTGDILFTGPPDINPVLNLQASYSGGGTIVYLDIHGTADNPQPTLRSDPPLAENDIISVLIFGHPLNQINASAGASDQTQSQQAQALAGSVIGGYLTQSLREKGMNLGLDVVRIDSSNTGGNRLTVGRYIGQKLFVSYGEPLQSTAVRVFDANYYLTNHWSVVGETGAGTDSFLELLFRYPLNQPPSARSSGFVTNTPYLPGPAQPLPFPQPNPIPVH